MAFFKNYSKKSKLKLGREYLFIVEDADFSADGSKVQIVFWIKDEKTGFKELILQEFDPQSDEFDELLRSGIYPGEADNIIKVNFADFYGVCGRCKITRVDGRSCIVTSSIEPDTGALSAMDSVYYENKMYPWQKSKSNKDRN